MDVIGMKEKRRQLWLKYISWTIAGVYVLVLRLWSILEPEIFSEYYDLALTGNINRCICTLNNSEEKWLI